MTRRLSWDGRAVLLFQNEYFEVELLDSEAIVVVTRSAKSFASLADAHRACGPMIATLDALGRESHFLLLDSRDAIGKNDPEYEQWFAQFRKELVAGFPRTAVLVRTIAGKLQSQRLLRADRAENSSGIFVELDLALEFLRTARRTSVPPSARHSSGQPTQPPNPRASRPSSKP